ncbi:MAG TPA: hypothetical protein VLF90_02890 [Patescibacteria group bacterium]|nr:hypothetical protein [Patescibacteria group bacterium]
MFRKKSRARQRPLDKAAADSKPAFSYYAHRSRSEEQGGRQMATKRPRANPWWHQVPSYIALGVIVVCLIYSLLLSSNAKVIVPVASPDTVFLRSPETYQKATQSLLSHSFLNKNKITIDSSGIAHQLEQQFPELQQVSITLPLIGHRPLVYIQPIPPALTLISKNGLYVVDERGRAVIAADKVNKLASLQLPVVTDQSGLEVGVGKPVLSGSDVEFIMTVTGQLKAQKLALQSLILPPQAAELDLRLSGQPYLVKLNLKADAKQQMGTFLAVKKQLETNKQAPAQYIDVRVDGRAYYQ